MALAMAIMAGVGVGANILNAWQQNRGIDQNIRRERQAATYRAEDRRQALRESLAAMRVAAVGQGSSFDSGSNLNLQHVSVQEFMSDAERDAFQTAGQIRSLKNAKISNILGALSGSANSLLSYASSSRETTGGSAGAPAYVPHRADGKH